MAQGLPLAGLRFGLLALGDSGYAHYCGFGRRLHHWLQAEGGAQPLFDPIEMDSGDPAALAAWQRQLAQVASIDAGQAWHRPEFQPWTLVARAHLNPGSAGGAVHHLELAPPPGATPDWQAGDLAAVRVPADPEHPRDYSIASIPADGRVHLMVRESWRADGSPGAASSWLCHGLVVGAQLDLRLRAHANFRAGGNAQRPWVLIGNGTGLAGLRSHLRARAAGPRHATGGDWLVYGERHAAHDRPYQAELQAWLHDGVLARLDLVFSRDSAERAYVQDRLRAHADVLRHWVRERGAALYVCGSLNGMAQGVDEALRDLLGSAEVDALARAGRYRRDVY
jgi:sulfite reductase (NADPH) flavoprotein alpha-component